MAVRLHYLAPRGDFSGVRAYNVLTGAEWVASLLLWRNIAYRKPLHPVDTMECRTHNGFRLAHRPAVALAKCQSRGVYEFRHSHNTKSGIVPNSSLCHVRAGNGQWFTWQCVHIACSFGTLCSQPATVQASSCSGLCSEG